MYGIFIKTSLFQPSHGIQSFLVISDCPDLCICQSDSHCIFPVRTHQIWFEEIISPFCLIFLLVLVVESQEIQPLFTIQMVTDLFYVLKTSRFHSDFLDCLVLQSIHKSAVMICTVGTTVSVRIVKSSTCPISV